MHFEDMNAFWQMGGYGLYVWLSFGMGALSIVVLWVESIVTKRKLFALVLSEQVRQARIKKAASEHDSSDLNSVIVE